MNHWRRGIALLAATAALLTVLPHPASALTLPKNPNDQGIGMQGVIPKAPPTSAATISLPSNGQTFSETPITVSGLCETGLLVRIYRNGAFGGAVMCENGAFTLQMDLFYGTNVITARVFDDLDQEGQQSNVVTVNFPPPDALPGTNVSTTIPGQVPDRINLSSNFGRRGADPRVEIVWPLILTGGNGPYALSIDWGDGSVPQLVSQAGTGQFDIKHIYDAAGTYKVIVKATDKNGQSAFLQLVAVVNGSKASAEADANAKINTVYRTKVMWQPSLITFPLLLLTFWLGTKYKLKQVRYRMRHRIFPIDK